MTIDLIHQRKIRIDLSAEDLTSFHVSYSQLSADDPQTRVMIGKLLSTADAAVGFEHADKKLFVETYPDNNGGCILYVTILKGEKCKETKKNRSVSFPPVILTLPTVNMVERMCSYVERLHKDRLLHSSLLVEADRYYLVLVCTAASDEEWHRLGKEWGCTVTTGKGELLRIREHGRILIPSGAVEVMANL